MKKFLLLSLLLSTGVYAFTPVTPAPDFAINATFGGSANGLVTTPTPDLAAPGQNTLVTNFGFTGSAVTAIAARDAVVDSNNNVIFGGILVNAAGASPWFLGSLLANGNNNTTYTGSGMYSVAQVTDFANLGIVGPRGDINATLYGTSTINGGGIFGMAIDSSNRVYAAGTVTITNYSTGPDAPAFNSERLAVVRYTTVGEVDPAFTAAAGNGGNILLTDAGATTQRSEGRAVVLDSAGNVYVCGHVLPGTLGVADGSLNAAPVVAKYNSSGVQTASAVFAEAGPTGYAGAFANTIAFEGVTGLAASPAIASATAIAVQGSNILVAGIYLAGSAGVRVPKLWVARLSQATLALDTSFGENGFLFVPFVSAPLLVATKVSQIIQEQNQDILLIANGSSVAPAAFPNIVPAATQPTRDNLMVFMRFDGNGMLFEDFDNGAIVLSLNNNLARVSSANAAAMQADGKIMVAGISNYVNGAAGTSGVMTLTNFIRDMSPNTTYGTTGIFTAPQPAGPLNVSANALAVQSASNANPNAAVLIGNQVDAVGTLIPNGINIYAVQYVPRPVGTVSALSTQLLSMTLAGILGL